MPHEAVPHTVEKKWISHPFSALYASPRPEIWVPNLGPWDVRDHSRFYRHTGRKPFVCLIISLDLRTFLYRSLLRCYPSYFHLVHLDGIWLLCVQPLSSSAWYSANVCTHSMTWKRNTPEETRWNPARLRRTHRARSILLYWIIFT